MCSVKAIKTAKIGYIVMSAVLCILGVLLIMAPEFFAPLIAKICGIALAVFGLVKLIGYFSRDLFRLAFQFDLASGILLMLLGAVMIFRADHAVVFAGIVLGVYILVDGLLKIQIALDAKQFGIGRWWLIFAAAVLTGIIGFLFVLRPTESGELFMILTGISLLAEGILNFITVLLAVRIIHNQRPDQIDAKSYRIEDVL